jgi:hypothetical protein
MKIADEISHRALDYISALSQQGYKVTVGELNAYIENPERRSQLGIVFTAAIMGKLFEYEPLADHLQRIRWIKRLTVKKGTLSDTDKVELTKLGTAVLKALKQQEFVAEPSPVIILKADDFLSYSRVISEISKYDECLLADPWFRVDNLPDLIDYTSCSRILTSENIGKSGKLALAVALKKITKKKFEIRVSNSKEFHDRFIVPKSGAVIFVGISINSVNRRFSVIGEISEPAAEEIRKAYEKFWADATSLKQKEASESQRP